MNRHLLDIDFTTERGAYVDAMYAVLQSKGWFGHSRAMLAGMTGMCFRFSVHRQLLPDSPTAYNWMAEHFVAADLIGVTASQMAGFHQRPTFPLYQRVAVERMIAAIRGGTAVISWQGDGFAVIHGYDERRRCLYWLDGRQTEARELPLAQVGRNQSPYWYGQILEAQEERGLLQTIKESYLQAVAKWETQEALLPAEDYACGKAAYGAIGTALHSGAYDPTGARATIAAYAEAKLAAAAYAAEAMTYWPALAPVAAQYAEAGRYWAEMAEALAAESRQGREPALGEKRERAQAREDAHETTTAATAATEQTGAVDRTEAIDREDAAMKRMDEASGAAEADAPSNAPLSSSLRALLRERLAAACER
ncbi:hypothetical protein, partial [Paenibacillus sp. 598K]|uniref:hypothetical protein n=1 Tax=Paenibacillus sp. 598K TaxID=1117987 RepID=UPI0016245B3B